MNRFKDKEIIQQYGFYHSGTGYIALLINKNFKNTIIIRCKKHDGPTNLEHGETYIAKDFALENYYNNDFVIDENSKGISEEELKYLNACPFIKYVITIKNPYVWCQRQIDRHPNRPVSVSIKNWNKANKRYFLFWVENRHSKKCVIIKYEDLLNDFEYSMHKIEDGLWLETKLEKFENINEFSNDLHEGREPEVKDFLKVWLEVYNRVMANKSLIQQINDCLDYQIMEWFGYEVER